MKLASIKTYTALSLVSLFYGVNYSILKIVTPAYIGPYGFILLRVSSASLIFSIMYFFNREPIDWKKDGGRLILAALTGVAINQLLFFKGISLTSAVNGSIIMALTPMTVLLWAYLLTKEKITLKKIVGMAFGIIGATLILYQPKNSLASGDWRGDILVFINGASYACYLVIVKPLMKKYKPLTIVTWIFLLALVFVVPVGFYQAKNVDFTLLPPKVWWSMTYAILIVTVVLYLINAWTLTHVKPDVIGAFIYLQPVFATLTAVIFFDGIVLVKHFFAALFIFVGLWIIAKKS